MCALKCDSEDDEGRICSIAASQSDKYYLYSTSKKNLPSSIVIEKDTPRRLKRERGRERERPRFGLIWKLKGGIAIKEFATSVFLSEFNREKKIPD